MRKTMIMVVLLGGMLIGLSAHAQQSSVDPAKLSYPNGVSSEKLEAVKENYLNCLRSQSEGVVESAIFYVVKFKMFYPDQDVEEIAAELDSLAITGSTPGIQYRAQLAGNFLSYPDWLDGIEKADYKDADQFFAKLSQQLQTKLLALERGSSK